MPVRLLNEPTGLYADPNVADYEARKRQREEFDSTVSRISQIGKAYQDYRRNQVDKEKYDDLIREAERVRPMGTAPSAQAEQDRLQGLLPSGMTMPQAPQRMLNPSAPGMPQPPSA